MRLWHIDLIPYLPRQQLLSQWRECIAIAKSLAEKGTPNHILVNRILDYPCYHFQEYGVAVTYEMRKRGYKLSYESGARFDEYVRKWTRERKDKPKYWTPKTRIFEYWHNDRYFMQCLYNLQEKWDCQGISNEEWKLIYSFNSQREVFKLIQSNHEGE